MPTPLKHLAEGGEHRDRARWLVEDAVQVRGCRTAESRARAGEQHPSPGPGPPRRLVGVHEVERLREPLPAPFRQQASQGGTPEAARAAGRFLPGCTGKALDYQTAIWTELQK